MLPPEEADEGGEDDKLSPDEFKAVTDGLKMAMNGLIDTYVANDDQMTISTLLVSLNRDPMHFAVVLKLIASVLRQSVNENGMVSITATEKGDHGAENTVLNLIVRGSDDPFPKKAFALIEQSFNAALKEYRASKINFN